MTNTCILVSLYFDKNIGLSTPNLPTSQAQPMFPIVYHTELTGSYALNGSISLNMPSSVTASRKFSGEKFGSMPYLETDFYRVHIVPPWITFLLNHMTNK